MNISFDFEFLSNIPHKVLLEKTITWLAFLLIFYKIYKENSKKSITLRLLITFSEIFLFVISLNFIFSGFEVFFHYFSEFLSLFSLKLNEMDIIFTCIAYILFPIAFFIYFLNEYKDFESKYTLALKNLFYFYLIHFCFFTLKIFFINILLYHETNFSLLENYFSFSICFFMIISIFFGSFSIINAIFLKSVEDFLSALELNFDTGVFNTITINSNMDDVEEEIQFLNEKYKLTGNSMNREQKKKLKELKNKKNLLEHRKNLTKQFVNPKTKALNIIHKTLALIKGILKLILALLSIFCLIFAILQMFFPLQNPLELLFVFCEENISGNFSLALQVFFKFFWIYYPFLQWRENQQFLSEKENEEIEYYLKKFCLGLAAINFFTFCCPSYSIFTQNCKYFKWNDSTWEVIENQCKFSSFGKIYERIISNREFLTGFVIENCFFGVLALGGFACVFFKNSTKKKNLK